MNSVTNEQLRRLLLGQSAIEELERLEEATLLEEGVAERLREQEFDLIDDYVSHRLDAADQRDMEGNYLITPERLMTVRVSRALAAQRASAAASKWHEPLRYWRIRGFQAFACAAGLAAVAFAVHWGLAVNTRGSASPAVAERRAELVEPIRVPVQKSKVFQGVTLLADANRDGSKPVVHLGLGDVAVRLQLEVPEPIQSALYSVELSSESRSGLFVASDLPLQGAGAYRFVEVTVPQDALGPGARSITLRVSGSGETSAPEYRWQIESVQDAGAQKK